MARHPTFDPKRNATSVLRGTSRTLILGNGEDEVFSGGRQPSILEIDLYGLFHATSINVGLLSTTSHPTVGCE